MKKQVQKDLAEIVLRMQSLRDELAGTDLQKLQIFNDAYLIITQNVQKNMHTGYFQHDDRLANLDVAFAKYYFDAIYEYRSTGHTVPAWQALFELCERGAGKSMLYLALGVNAHINNDLGQALHDAKVGRDYRRDYQLVNKIIDDSRDAIIAECGISWRGRNDLVRAGMSGVVRAWRENAWRTYRELEVGKTNRADIEHRAASIARELTRLPWPV